MATVQWEMVRDGIAGIWNQIEQDLRTKRKRWVFILRTEGNL